MNQRRALMAYKIFTVADVMRPINLKEDNLKSSMELSAKIEFGG